MEGKLNCINLLNYISPTETRERAIELNPSYDTYLKIYSHRLKIKPLHLEECINIKNKLIEIIDKYPDDKRAYELMGKLYLHIKYYKKAIFYYKKYLKLYRRNYDTLFDLSVCYYGLNRFEVAINYLNICEKLNPDCINDIKYNSLLAKCFEGLCIFYSDKRIK